MTTPIRTSHIHQKKGYRLLDGDDAMQVLRYRHDNEEWHIRAIRTGIWAASRPSRPS